MKELKKKQITDKITEQVVDLMLDWELEEIPREIRAHVMMSCAVNLAYRASSSDEEAQEIMLDYIASYSSADTKKSVH